MSPAFHTPRNTVSIMLSMMCPRSIAARKLVPVICLAAGLHRIQYHLSVTLAALEVVQPVVSRNVVPTIPLAPLRGERGGFGSTKGTPPDSAGGTTLEPEGPAMVDNGVTHGVLALLPVA